VIWNQKKRRKKVMSNKEKREALLDRMIHIYGFEHERVIDFCHKVDNKRYSTMMLTIMVHIEERHAKW
jgi:hypothetical protein